MVFELNTGEEYSELCVYKLHSIICVHSLVYFHAIVWSRSLHGFVSVALVYVVRMQCGETMHAALLWQRRKALFLQSEYKVRGPLLCFL